MKKIAAVILLCLFLTGCGMGAAAFTPTPAPTSAPVHRVSIYKPDADAMGFVTVSVELTELSPEALCRALTEQGVLNEGAAFNSLSLENGEIKLDVNGTFVSQLRSCGTTGEYLMTGSVVNTLLSAYGAQSLSLTGDGEIIESGHVIYDFPLEFYE